ncbi:MAG: LytTR family transcriptional regulator DNA-binding domain-containing protein [Ferruginibacter sp.]|nr:LytTR family transcriptional regulator DNA-binding domain-containing protein [Ferruginibacter sp.]
MEQEIISEERAIVSARQIYHDKWLWHFGYPLFATAMIFIANDNSFTDLISNPSFYTDLLFAFTVTYLSGFYLKKITVWLDKKKCWHNALKKRALLQLLAGVLLPLGACMLLEIVYLYSIGIPPRESSILYLEFPLSFLFLLLANLFYIVHYLLYSEQIKTIIIGPKKSISLPDFITVQIGFTEKQIPLADCAVIISKGKLLWLHSFDGEQYRLPGTMDEWEQKLNRADFYRLNRQFLAAHKVIRAIEQTATRKILVHLSLFAGEEVYVSKEKSAGFQHWWRTARPA